MTMTPAQQIVQLEYVVREQIKEIDRLRTENQALVDWIQGDSSHAYRPIHNSSTASEANRIKAAASAIGHERPKVATTTNLLVVDFRERVRQARQKATEPKVIEHIPSS